MNTQPTSTSHPIWRWRQGEALREDQDELAQEEPLEIRVRGRAVSVTMRTPGHDEELAAGFLLSEGLIRNRADVVRIDPCGRAAEGNVVNVFLAPDVEVDFDRLTRHVFASSSCGLCGKASIEEVHQHFEPITDNTLRISAAVIEGLPDALHTAQATFARTGGLHAAAIFDAQGQLLVLREDVGRHNAVDKVIGHALLQGKPLDAHVLLVSGRASFEIMQKALAGRLPVVAAVSAPSSLAAEFARDSRQTLIAFLRPGRMNVYAEPQRLDFDRPSSASF